MFRRPTLVMGASLRQLVGGRWAVSLPMFAIGLPLNVIATFANNVSLNSSLGVVLTWLLLALLGYLTVGLVFLLWDVTILRNRRTSPVAPWLVVLMGAMAGLARALVIEVAHGPLGLSLADSTSTVDRFISGAVVGALLIPLGAWVFAIIDHFRTQRDSLMAEKVAMEQQRLRAEGERQALLQTVVESVREQVTHRIDRTARDVGRSLWPAEDPVDIPRLSWWTVLRSSVLHNPFSVIPVLLVWVPVAWLTVAPEIGFARATVQMIYSAMCLTAVFAVGKWLSRNQPRASGWVLLGVIVISWAATSPLAWMIFDPRPSSAGSNLWAMNALWTPLVIILVAVVRNAFSDSTRILQKLQHETTQAEIQAVAAQSELADIRRQVAIVLHGNVQSRITVADALLAGERSDFVSASISAALHESLGDLENPDLFASLDSHQVRSLRRALEESVDLWAPIMDIEWSCPDVASHRATDVTRIVEEALANAHRHGAAERVKIDVTVMPATDNSPTSITIHVIDSGSGLASDAQPGLGSQLLDSLAPQTWQRRNRPEGGSELIVTMTG